MTYAAAWLESSEWSYSLLLQTKPKRKAPEKPEARPLTQAELLAEAAYTELENLRSLEAHLAAEEEFKKKAAIKRSKYSGPLIRFRSKSINSEAVVGLIKPLLHQLIIVA